MQLRLDELSEKTGTRVELDDAASEPKVVEKKAMKRKRESRESQQEDLDEDDEDELDEEELLKDANDDELMIEYRSKLDYITSALDFIKAIEFAVAKISTMLESKNASDVVESLRFFNRAVNFKIAGALGMFKE